MQDEATARLTMPLLQPDQAQKEMFHNEALVLLDMATQAVVEAVGLSSPPVALPGQCWIVGDDPDGVWADHEGALAGFTAGGWRFATPFPGMSAWSREDGCVARYDDGVWTVGDVSGRELVIGGMKVVGQQSGEIDGPAGGLTIDTEARAALDAILTALRNHGLIAT